MSADALFPILNLAAMAAWVPLILLPRRRWATTVLPIAMPVLLAVAYVVLVAVSVPGGDGSFSSLDGVRRLFRDPYGLLAGWTHYLAFDLFIGGWQVRDAQERGIRHLFVVPALVLTFLFGPAGLLLYLTIRRFAPTRRDDDGARVMTPLAFLGERR